METPPRSRNRTMWEPWRPHAQFPVSTYLFPKEKTNLCHHYRVLLGFCLFVCVAFVFSFGVLGFQCRTSCLIGLLLRVGSQISLPGASLILQSFYLQPGITNICHYAQHVYWGRVSLTFCPGWLWTLILLISASWAAVIISMSHRVQLVLPVFVDCKLCHREHSYACFLNLSQATFG
jgi:hypothetical protein